MLYYTKLHTIVTFYALQFIRSGVLFYSIMRITKDNYKSIECVKFADVIEFTDDLEYNVTKRWLSNNEGSNYAIFDVLDVDGKEFCEKAYGYKPYSGGFPECEEKDYPALTRVVKALFEALYPEGIRIETKFDTKQFINCDIDINVKINI